MDKFEQLALDWYAQHPTLGPHPHFTGAVVGNLQFDAGTHMLPKPPEKLGNKKLRDAWIQECRSFILAQPESFRRQGMVYALHSALWYSNYRRLADTATEGL